jgi:hypothetical protein
MRLLALAPLLLTLAAPVVTAQGRHVFDVDPATSTFTFSGSAFVGTLGGNIVGNPPSVTPGGAFAIDVTSNGTQIVSAQVVDGNDASIVLPTLNAFVPNPIPIFPPLASIQGTNIELKFRSVDALGNPAAFSVAPNGQFTATFLVEAVSGTLSITGLVNDVIDIAGQVSDPATINGSLTAAADGLDLQIPIASTFNFFFDPLSATLNLNGAFNCSDRSFATDVPGFGAATGGTQTMTLSAGTANAGRAYIVLASASGTSPGVPLPGGFNLPLVLDGFFIDSFNGANIFPWGNTLGTLDGVGTANATFSLPPLPAFLAGLQIWHAYAVIDATTVFATSDPVVLTLQ